MANPNPNPNPDPNPNPNPSPNPDPNPDQLSLSLTRLCEAVLHVLLLPLAPQLPAFRLELLRLLEEAREPLQRLKAGPSKGSVLAGVLLAARERGVGEAYEEALEKQRWQALHMGAHG